MFGPSGLASDGLRQNVDDATARTKFGLIYDLHRRSILAYCRRRAGEQDALDIMSETFAIVWRRIDKAPDPESALPWLYSTARGALSNHRRSGKRYARLIARTGSLAPASPPGPEVQVVHSQELEAVARALQRLRFRDREILQLHVWEELPHAEIGAALGISENAASQRLSRALKRLTAEVDRTSARVASTRLAREGGSK